MNKTNCPKIGIKIHESNNECKTNPFECNPKPNLTANTKTKSIIFKNRKFHQKIDIQDFDNLKDNIN